MRTITIAGLALPGIPLAVGYVAALAGLVRDYPVLVLLLAEAPIAAALIWYLNRRRAAACTCPVIRNGEQLIPFHNPHCPNRH